MPEQKAQLLEIVINAVEDKTISSTIAGNVKEVLETFAFDQIGTYRACEGAWKGQIQNKMTVQFK